MSVLTARPIRIYYRPETEFHQYIESDVFTDDLRRRHPGLQRGVHSCEEVGPMHTPYTHVVCRWLEAHLVT